MATDVRGHDSPAASETPSRSTFTKMSLSIKDPIPVANTTARAALIVSLAAASPAVVPSTSNPVYVHRADAGAGRELEYTTDGTNFRTVYAETTPWTAPTLTGSWVAFGGGFRTAAYRKVGGDVQLRGTVKSGGTGSANPIFTLPSGFRPVSDEARLILSNVGGADLRIDTSGRVYVAAYIAGGDNAILSIGGVEFTADGS